MALPKLGQIVHTEYTSSDPAATRKFFERSFGWKFAQQPMPAGMEYWTFRAPGGTNGGVMTPLEKQPEGTTMTYVLVKSVDEAAARAEKDGATICVPKQQVPGAGWFSIVEVPGGVQFALWEPDRPARARPRARPKKAKRSKKR